MHVEVEHLFNTHNPPHHCVTNIQFSCNRSCTSRREIGKTFTILGFSVSGVRPLRFYPALGFITWQDPVSPSRRSMFVKWYSVENVSSGIALCTSSVLGVHCHQLRRKLYPYPHIPCLYSLTCFERRLMPTNEYLLAAFIFPIQIRNLHMRWFLILNRSAPNPLICLTIAFVRLTVLPMSFSMIFTD